MLSFDGRIVFIHLQPLAAGEHSCTTIQGPNGTQGVPNYALTQGIFIGCVAAYIPVLALIGPENHGRHFERGKTAFQAGASKEDVTTTLAGVDGVQGRVCGVKEVRRRKSCNMLKAKDRPGTTLRESLPGQSMVSMGFPRACEIRVPMLNPEQW